jgi:hypothetical protein
MQAMFNHFVRKLFWRAQYNHGGAALLPPRVLNNRVSLAGKLKSTGLAARLQQGTQRAAAASHQIAAFRTRATHQNEPQIE